MRFRWFTLVMVLCAIPLVSPAGEKADNPLKNAKIGDYVVYKMTTSEGGIDIEMTIKRTVVPAKNGKDLTIQSVATAEGKTVPFDPTPLVTASLKAQKKGEGKEKIKVGDKTYDCTWILAKGVGADAGGAKVEFEAKLWTDKSVPLDGMVKWEYKSALGNMRMEITGSGRVK